jgi:hypothetical protein
VEKDPDSSDPLLNQQSESSSSKNNTASKKGSHRTEGLMEMLRRSRNEIGKETPSQDPTETFKSPADENLEEIDSSNKASTSRVTLDGVREEEMFQQETFDEGLVEEEAGTDIGEQTAEQKELKLRDLEAGNGEFTHFEQVTRQDSFIMNWKLSRKKSVHRSRRGA